MSNITHTLNLVQQTISTLIHHMNSRPLNLLTINSHTPWLLDTNTLNTHTDSSQSSTSTSITSNEGCLKRKRVDSIDIKSKDAFDSIDKRANTTTIDETQSSLESRTVQVLPMPSKLSELPIEILAIIFQNVNSDQDRKNINLVSKLFRNINYIHATFQAPKLNNISKDTFINYIQARSTCKFFSDDFLVQPIILESLSWMSTDIFEKYISELPGRSQTNVFSATKLPILTRINLNLVFKNNKVLQNLCVNRCYALESLVFEATETSPAINQLNTAPLETLDLSHCRALYANTFESWPVFENLTTINLAGCHNINRNTLVELLRIAPNLKVLNLSWCVKLRRLDAELLARFARLEQIVLIGSGIKYGDRTNLKSKLPQDSTIEIVSSIFVDTNSDLELDSNNPINASQEIPTIHDVIKSGNLTVFKSYLDKIVKAAPETVLEITPLHTAAEVGNCAMISLLINKGFDIDCIEPENHYTPLFLAAKKGHLEAVRLLIDRGANLNLRDFGDSALISNLATCMSRTRKSMEPSISEADTTALNKEYNQDLEIFNALLDAGSSQKIEEADIGETLLHLAARNDEYNLMRILLEQGLNPNIRDEWGWTPLHHAAHSDYSSGDNEEMIDILVDAEADIEAKTIKNEDEDENELDNMTALWIAAKEGKMEVVKRLIERGANIHTLNSNETSIISYIIGSTVILNDESPLLIEIISLCIEKDLNILFLQNDLGETLLHQLVRKVIEDHLSYTSERYLNILKYLLDRGAPTISNKAGQTPLAIYNSSLKKDKSRSKAQEAWIQLLGKDEWIRYLSNEEHVDWLIS